MKGSGHIAEPQAMYIGSVAGKLYFSMNNAIAGLSVLFQRGAGPSHILLLQEIRAHNSPDPWCTAPSTPPGASPLLMDQVRVRQWETKNVSSQKVMHCS